MSDTEANRIVVSYAPRWDEWVVDIAHHDGPLSLGFRKTKKAAVALAEREAARLSRPWVVEVEE